MCPISILQVGHCSARAHRASSNAACVCWSGTAQHRAKAPATCLSHPSSLSSAAIQGWARTQPPSACRPSLQSSAVSSQLSSQLELTVSGPEVEPESRALRRKRSAVQKNLLWLASSEPGKKHKTPLNEIQLQPLAHVTFTLQTRSKAFGKNGSKVGCKLHLASCSTGKAVFTWRWCWFKSTNHQTQRTEISSKDLQMGLVHQNRKCFTQKVLQRFERRILPRNRRSALAFPEQRCTRGTTYRTLSGSVTAKLSRTEQAVSMLGSLVNDTLLLPLSDVQHFDRKSTSRAWVSRVSSTLLGPSSADR